MGVSCYVFGCVFCCDNSIEWEIIVNVFGYYYDIW